VKITVGADGEVTVETTNVNEALAMINALRNGRNKEADVPLSPLLHQAWEWLVAHDSPEGVSPVVMAEEFGVPTATATWRLSALIRKGLAHRVARGCYRPGEKE
jgi:hypothetical protein